MSKNSSKDEKVKSFLNNSLKLPDFVTQNQTAQEVLSVEGTNVIRVPFGIRTSRRKRPEKNQNIATLVLPITSVNSPTPPNVA